MDCIDFSILDTLCTNGRASWSELARQLDFSSSSIIDRVRKLEESGVIEGYTTIISPEHMGYPVVAFISVTLENPCFRDSFVDFIKSSKESLECHHIAGEWDYLVKGRFKSMSHLEKFVSEVIKGTKGIKATKTSIALSTVKETIFRPF